MSYELQNWALFEVEEISPSERLVLTYICAYANKNGSCYPSQSTISKKSGLSRATVNSAIKNLENKGLLASSGQTGSSKTYQIKVSQPVKPLDTTCQTVRQPLSNDLTPPVKPFDTNKLINQSINNNINIISDFGFEEFWEAYPHKIGIDAAREAYFSRIEQGIKHQKIIEGLERYKQTKPPSYSWLNPTTFLNQGRYADEPDYTISAKKSSYYNNFNRPSGGEITRNAFAKAIAKAALKTSQPIN